MKKFAFIVWILIATNWYSSGQNPFEKKGYISLAKSAGDDPPLIKEHTFVVSDNISKTGLHFGAIIEIEISDNFSLHPDNILSEKQLKSDYCSATDKVIQSIDIPIISKLNFPKRPNVYMQPFDGSEKASGLISDLKTRCSFPKNSIESKRPLPKIFFNIKYYYNINNSGKQNREIVCYSSKGQAAGFSAGYMMFCN